MFYLGTVRFLVGRWLLFRKHSSALLQNEANEGSHHVLHVSWRRDGRCAGNGVLLFHGSGSRDQLPAEFAILNCLHCWPIRRP